jgi:hypothetical protein
MARGGRTGVGKKAVDTIFGARCFLFTNWVDSFASFAMLDTTLSS